MTRGTFFTDDKPCINTTSPQNQFPRTVLFFSFLPLKNLKRLSEVVDREASAEEVADLCEAWLIG